MKKLFLVLALIPSLISASTISVEFEDNTMQSEFNCSWNEQLQKFDDAKIDLGDEIRVHITRLGRAGKGYEVELTKEGKILAKPVLIVEPNNEGRITFGETKRNDQGQMHRKVTLEVRLKA